MSMPPQWRLPIGVNASLWQYAHSARLARDEETYFAGHPLFAADSHLLAERFVEPGPLIDLGCGSGRHTLQFARRGFPVVAVDLSWWMLHVLGERTRAEGLRVARVQANLCGLGCLPDRTFQYALSMFSTLGMIRSTRARERALEETFRILQPGGWVALHAHNIWLNIHDRQGRRWLLKQAGKVLRRQPDAGDRRMFYRGVPNMEVHLYRWRELRRELRAAGFKITEVVPIDTTSARLIPAPWFFHSLRAGGWVVFARRPRQLMPLRSTRLSNCV
jgi:ubiquinone/menaquinone biosynthesis C-methylase UbiE